MEAVNFKREVEDLRQFGMNLAIERIYIRIPDAKQILWRGLQFFGKEEVFEAKWLPEYNEVATWLGDNQGRGLLLYGNCGRGKSLIACKILPILFKHYCRKILRVYDMQTVNRDLDDIITKYLKVLDDAGTEEVSNNYGNKRMALSEVVDEAEKKGHLVVITTNLTLSEVAVKYGNRTLDRLKKITTPVLFKGESLRK